MGFNKTLVIEKAKEIRRLTMDAIGHLGVGHIGGSLSIAEVLSVLYFSEMNIDASNPKMEGRDRFVLSKGHAGPALYAALSIRGYFQKEALYTLNELGTNLPSHTDMRLTPGVDMTSGSLGQGFSCAVGIAAGAKLRNDGARVFAIIGDGESQEGQIWEAAMLAAHMKLNNFIAFTDNNGMQIDGATDDVNSLGRLEKKWDSFGFYTQEIDGHNVEDIYEAIQKAKGRSDKPSMIILNTVKGKGISFVEKAGFANHNMTFNAEQYKLAMSELE